MFPYWSIVASAISPVTEPKPLICRNRAPAPSERLLSRHELPPHLYVLPLYSIVEGLTAELSLKLTSLYVKTSRITKGVKDGNWSPAISFALSFNLPFRVVAAITFFTFSTVLPPAPRENPTFISKVLRVPYLNFTVPSCSLVWCFTPPFFFLTFDSLSVAPNLKFSSVKLVSKWNFSELSSSNFISLMTLHPTVIVIGTPMTMGIDRTSGSARIYSYLLNELAGKKPSDSTSDPSVQKTPMDVAPLNFLPSMPKAVLTLLVRSTLIPVSDSLTATVK